MFSRSLAASPSPTRPPPYERPPQRGSHMDVRRLSLSPSPPPAQTADSFDVTLLLPHRYGGVSELHQQEGGSFGPLGSPAGVAADQVSFNSSPRSAGDNQSYYAFKRDTNSNGTEDNVDFFGRMSHEVMEDAAVISERGSISARDGFYGNVAPHSVVNTEASKTSDNNAGIKDLLKFRPGRRSQSRLSTLIQVQPYDQLKDKDKQQQELEDKVSDKLLTSESNGDLGGGLRPRRDCDSHSAYDVHVLQSPAARVARSNSFNYMATGTSMHGSSPASPQPQGLPPYHSPSQHNRPGAHFIPRKLSSGSFYAPTNETRKSRVTL